MTRERWTEIKPLLDRALDLSKAERHQFIEQNCRTDSELRLELERYLELESEVDTLFDRPILDLIAGRSPEYRAGQRIGAFRLEDEIAQGGMGVVYRAKRVEGGFEQIVAIKVLKRGFDTGDFVRRFRAEQQILANLDHPHIARLLDGGATEDGLPYLVMELVDGICLDAFCRHHKLSLEDRIGLFIKISDAVHTAHQHMVVHCDLKPSNILVTPKGEPKLLDFGIAKVMRQDPGSMTRSFSMRLGTPPFASPEQISGGDITSSSDVYGLGEILFLLLTDQKPKDAKKAADSVQLPSRASGSSMDRQVLRGDLDAIVLKSMAQEPADRYHSVAALREDLNRHQKRLPVEAQTYTWTYALRLLAIRRRRELMIAAGTLLVILAVNLGWFLFQRHLETVRAEEMVATSLEMLEIFDSTADESATDAARTLFQNLLNTPTLAASEQQAHLYDRLGRYLLRHEHPEEARPFLERALTLRQTAQQPVLEDQAASFNNLALSFKKNGQLESAVFFLEMAAAQYRQHPEWDRGEALDVLHNLASVERQRGNTQTALDLYREALEQRRTYHGERSKEVARTLNNLGSLLIREFRLEEAESYFEEALSIREEIYGPGHTNVTTSLIGLASVREAQDRADEAIGLYRRAAEIRRKQLGDTSPATARACSALGFALLGRGTEADLLEARRLLSQAVSGLDLDREANREAGMVARRNFAAVLLELDELQAAKEQLDAVSGLIESWSPANAWRTADIQNLKGAVASAEGRIDEARAFFEGTVTIIEASKGAESRYAQEARERLQRFEDLFESAKLETR